jgi:hypothetical protein
MKPVVLVLLALGIWGVAWGFQTASNPADAAIRHDTRFIGVLLLAAAGGLGVLAALFRKVQVEGVAAIPSMGPAFVELEHDVPDRFRDDSDTTGPSAGDS